MARFQREAKVLASLDHPNIASIYGLEDSRSVHALVMQLAERPMLADRMSFAASAQTEPSAYGSARWTRQKRDRACSESIGTRTRLMGAIETVDRPQ
jgi:hypothetical protein